MSKKDQKIKLILKSDKMNDFISHIDDLCKISDVAKLKIDNNHIHLYSMLGENIMLAFKNFILPTSEYFEGYNEDFTLNIIIADINKFVKNFSLIKKESKIEWEITYRHTNSDTEGESRIMIIKNGKFKLQPPCGEDTLVKDISKEKIKKYQDLKNKIWSFVIKSDDFNDIKKLSNINKDEKRKIVKIESEKGKVILSEESVWELEVDEIEDPNRYNLAINKSLLSTIKVRDEIQFHVFENFILVKDGLESLMISFENSFD